jgi:hypothetical protein
VYLDTDAKGRDALVRDLREVTALLDYEDSSPPSLGEQGDDGRADPTVECDVCQSELELGADSHEFHRPVCPDCLKAAQDANDVGRDEPSPAVGLTVEDRDDLELRILDVLENPPDAKSYPGENYTVPERLARAIADRLGGRVKAKVEYTADGRPAFSAAQLAALPADLAGARRYMASHQEPDGGWTVEDLMHDVESPGIEDPKYAALVLSLSAVSGGPDTNGGDDGTSFTVKLAAQPAKVLGYLVGHDGFHSAAAISQGLNRDIGTRSTCSACRTLQSIGAATCRQHDSGYWTWAVTEDGIDLWNSRGEGPVGDDGEDR